MKRTEIPSIFAMNAIPGRHRPSFALHCGVCLLFFTVASRAEVLEASSGQRDDFFGSSTSVSGTGALLGAQSSNALDGSAYLFRHVDTVIGPITETATLVASDGNIYDYFGYSSSLSGSFGIVGAPNATVFGKPYQGAAYLFRNLDTASGVVTQAAKLTASTGLTGDDFGSTIALSGSVALVAASEESSNSSRGSVYLFRDLDTATGTVTESARLRVSASGANLNFGSSMSLQGNTALIAAPGANMAGLYRNLDTVSGSAIETARLSLPFTEAALGMSVSLSGTMGLVSAYLPFSSNGQIAFVYRNLGTASGTISPRVQLTASDLKQTEFFTGSIGLSGTNALVANWGADLNRGAVYLFQALDIASGTITEAVKLTASDRDASVGDEFQGPSFGVSLALEGDHFVIAASQGNGAVQKSGKAYSGTISSVTTLDGGDVSARISGISFASRTDWIIGEKTSGNRLTLGAGDKADVTAAGKAVFLGKNAASNGNLLRIDGTLTANEVYIGAVGGSHRNILQLSGTAAFQATAFRLAPDNLLEIEGNYSSIDGLLAYFGTTPLQVWDGKLWQTVSNSNYTNLIATSLTSGYTDITPAPEPASALLLLLGASGIVSRRQRQRSVNRNA